MLKKDLRTQSDAIFLPVDFEFYKKLSDKGMEIMEKNSDVFEYVGKDEAFLDVTKKVQSDWSKAENLGLEIKNEIKDKLNLTCSDWNFTQQTNFKNCFGFSKT